MASLYVVTSRRRGYLCLGHRDAPHAAQSMASRRLLVRGGGRGEILHQHLSQAGEGGVEAPGSGPRGGPPGTTPAAAGP